MKRTCNYTISFSSTGKWNKKFVKLLAVDLFKQLLPLCVISFCQFLLLSPTTHFLHFTSLLACIFSLVSPYANGIRLRYFFFLKKTMQLFFSVFVLRFYFYFESCVAKLLISGKVHTNSYVKLEDLSAENIPFIREMHLHTHICDMKSQSLRC